MDDEELYLEAAREVESDRKDAALWAKAMALTEGDHEKAKYLYVKLKVEKLTTNKVEAVTAVAKKPLNEFDSKYLPVAEFAKIKNIPEDKIIKMIRDGFYMGRIKDEAWYISREEVNNAASSGVNKKSVTGASASAETYDVYHHAAHGYEAVKRGFSWPAFFCHIFWAFVKKLWVHGSALLVIYFSLSFIQSAFAYKGETDAVFVINLIYLIIWLVFGIFGNDWRRTNLTMRGYDRLYAVNAESPDDAIAFVIKKDTN